MSQGPGSHRRSSNEQGNTKSRAELITDTATTICTMENACNFLDKNGFLLKEDPILTDILSYTLLSLAHSTPMRMIQEGSRAVTILVGCMYASEPFNSSLIYYQRLFHSNPINKHQKQLKYILSIFLVFLLTLFLCHLYFLCYMLYEGLCHLLPSRPFDSVSRKRLLTHQLYPTIWPPNGQGAKVPGK